MHQTDRDVVIQAIKENLWPHYAFQSEIREKGPKVLVKGDGAILWDIEGREYIDGHSILWVVNVGHGRKEIVQAMAQQGEKISYASLFGGYSNEPAGLLAKKLAEITPGDLWVSFLVSGGSEAVEAAIKIARQYQMLMGFPQRFKIIARKESYHGATLGALSCTGLRVYRTSFEPLLPGFVHVPPPYCYRCEFQLEYPSCNIQCVKAIEEAILWEGPKTVAAVIAEPVMSAAGALVPPPEYFPRLREICDHYGVLLIIDEVLNAFGRTGKMFAIERYGIVPDIMTLAKALSGGYAPIGAAVVRKEIFEAFQDYMMMHGITYGGHPLSCVAALKNIEIMERENLPQRGEEMGRELGKLLEPLKKHKMVGDIRGIGLHYALEYVLDKNTKARIPGDQRVAARVEELCWKKGLYLCRASVDKTYIAPPLVVTNDQLQRIVEILDQSISEVEREIFS
ncbi:MAG: aspartate aminotransferase family protein [Caldiserica bacterium]|jgi:adenosylmethionine-8-amino-7-oxononanoate aminotransferase|nr:aspartate aminotransferase family protein [Caldisericota bacterium]MDH7563067.1 aspartate aminotransferase family protein [Caldisericota bacterium]